MHTVCSMVPVQNYGPIESELQPAITRGRIVRRLTLTHVLLFPMPFHPSSSAQALSQDARHLCSIFSNRALMNYESCQLSGLVQGFQPSDGGPSTTEARVQHPAHIQRKKDPWGAQLHKEGHPFTVSAPAGTCASLRSSVIPQATCPSLPLPHM